MVEDSDLLKILQCIGQPPITNNCSFQNVSSAKVENLNLKLLGQCINITALPLDNGSNVVWHCIKHDF